MIDRSLNYGRENVADFISAAGPRANVLDIGAGQGDDLLLARKILPSARLFALESFPANVQKLRGLGIECRHVNIERDRFPFDPESVDVVIANQILEHTKEVFWVLDQVSRTLRVGGQFIIGVPNLAALHNRLLLLLGHQPASIKNDSAHIRGYTKRDMLGLLDHPFPGGYGLKGFSGGNFYPFPARVAKLLAAGFPSLAVCIFFRLEKLRPYDGGYLRFPGERFLETNFFVGETQP